MPPTRAATVLLTSDERRDYPEWLEISGSQNPVACFGLGGVGERQCVISIRNELVSPIRRAPRSRQHS